MPKKIIHVNPERFGSLHCDACGYDSPRAVPLGEFESGALIGTPCPHCGANMLTRRDWESSMKLLRVVAWLNRWFGWLGHEDPGHKDFQAVQIHIHNDELRARSVTPETPRA